ncbi:MAG TPA: Gfo/Idh/MocA family oxidoreductase [Candidatus Polarisedimenticolia bacterium]|nr:Gfo/Idh/MocA family oxidoreductase [Candidatus Polarisedimenticolia bacterium]
METLQLGLIGMGSHGARYAAHLAAGEVEGARLAVTCRRNRAAGEAQAEKLDARFTADYRQVLEDSEVDAVIIVVPPALNVPIAAEAIAAGKGVLVEKPLAPDAVSARRLVEAARAAAIPAMVAQTLRFNAVVLAVRERLASLGPLRLISLSQRFEPSSRAWLDEPESGGILRNTGVHSFDLIRFLTGREVEEALCFTQSIITRHTEDAFAAVLRLSGGALAVVENDRATAARSGGIEVVGERGQLRGDHVRHTLEEGRGNEWTPIPLSPKAATVRECLKAFVAALRGEAPVAIPLEEGLRAVAIVDACRESAEKKGPRRVAGPGSVESDSVSRES